MKFETDEEYMAGKSLRTNCRISVFAVVSVTSRLTTGYPGSVIVPQYGSSKITVFVWGKNTILEFLGDTKYRSIKLTLQLFVVVLIAPTKFRDNLQ